MAEKSNIFLLNINGAGPSDVNSRALKAMLSLMVGHMDSYFIHVIDEIM